MARNDIVRESVQKVSGDGAESSRFQREAESPSLSPEDIVIGKIAAFADVHREHDWLILDARGRSFTLWCNDCFDLFAYHEEEGGE